MWPFVVGLTIVMALAGVAPAGAQNAKNEDGQGKYAELTAIWWQWTLGLPAVDIDGNNTNPIMDNTGQYATVGQENGIGPGNRWFFLTGTFGWATERTVTVPAGKALFLPIANWDVDNAMDPITYFTVPELRAMAAAYVDGVTGAYARLDGSDLVIRRVKSPVFEYTLPEENSIYDYFGMFGPQFEGTVRPAVSDGLWVAIDPLPKGEYLLEFGSDGPIKLVYHLTIE